MELDAAGPKSVTSHKNVTGFSVRQAELIAASLWLAGAVFFGVRVLLAQLTLRRMLRAAEEHKPLAHTRRLSIVDRADEQGLA